MRPLNFDDFLRLLDIHQPVTIEEEHIKQAEEEASDEPELVNIPSYYPTIKMQPTGGYILPSKILPWRFKNRLVHEATDTKIYDNQHFMIDEMIINAYYGNSYDENKVIYLLWHKCRLGKEVYVVDEGEVKFSLEEIIKGSVGKPSDTPGTDFLRLYSKEFEYFEVTATNAKKGTFLRIVLEKVGQTLPTQTEEICHYIGHKLFDKAEFK